MMLEASTNFRVYQHNIRGYYSKQHNLLNNLTSNNYPHICLLQECFKSSKSVNNINILTSHYKTLTSQTGRCITLARNEVTIEPVKTLDDEYLEDKFYDKHGYESLWTKVQISKDKHIIFGNIYRNPTKSLDEFNYSLFSQEIKKAKQNCKHIILGGDFNAYNPIWGCNKLDNIGSCLWNIFINNQLLVLNQDVATYKNSSDNTTNPVLDLVVGSYEIQAHISNITIDDEKYYLGSDHTPLTYSVADSYYTDKILTSKHNSWRFDSQKDNDAVKLANKLFTQFQKQLPTSYKNDTTLLDQFINEWTNLTITVTQQIYGEKETKPNYKPWWSSKLSRLRQRSRLLERKYHREKTEETKSKWKQKHSEYKRLIASNKQKVAEKTCNNLDTSNIKKLFSNYKNYTQKNITTIPSLIAPVK